MQALEQKERFRKALEARKKAEALHQAFNQRDEFEDTTSVVEKRVGQKSWIEQHESPPPIIKVDNALDVD